MLISYQKNIGNKNIFSKGMRLNVSLADLSTLKALANITLCLEVFLKARVIKSQSGSCRRRFLGFLCLIIIFFWQHTKTFPIASSSWIAWFEFFSFDCPGSSWQDCCTWGRAGNAFLTKAQFPDHNVVWFKKGGLSGSDIVLQFAQWKMSCGLLSPHARPAHQWSCKNAHHEAGGFE